MLRKFVCWLLTLLMVIVLLPSEVMALEDPVTGLPDTEAVEQPLTEEPAAEEASISEDESASEEPAAADQPEENQPEAEEPEEEISEEPEEEWNLQEAPTLGAGDIIAIEQVTTREVVEQDSGF